MSQIKRTLTIICMLLIVIGTLLIAKSRALAQPLSQNVIDQIAAISAEKAARTPAQRKIDSALLDATHPSPYATSAIGGVRSAVEVDARGVTLVDIKAKVTDTLLAKIRGQGGTIVSSLPEYNFIRASIRVSALEQIASSPEVRSVRPAEQPFFNKVVSEGDITHRATQARTNLHVDGAGITVGVLSDSSQALASLQAMGDLPPTCPAGPPCVTILPRKAAVGNSEGTAMMEIINSLAPKSNLIFVTGNGGAPAMAFNIKALKAAGARVIVDDISCFLEPVFQDGNRAGSEQRRCGRSGLFSSAANSGNKLTAPRAPGKATMSGWPCPVLWPEREYRR